MDARAAPTLASRWLHCLRFALASLLCAAGFARAAPVLLLEVQDAVGVASAGYITRGIERAEASGAPLVVIRLDTPGGLDTSMRQVIQRILAARVPVAVYVAPEGARAASAGTYILYAAHVAAMAPATTLGAATPVAIGMPGGGRDPPRPEGGSPARDEQAELRDPMTAKQVNDAAAFIRGLAQQRGRNADWAELAVRKAVTLTADEALRERVVDVVAADVADLLRQLHGRRVRLQSGEVTLDTRDASVHTIVPDWRQRLLSTIANPSFALVLLMVGFYGLLFEFASPGFGVPGTVGAIALLLALFALHLLPVNYAGLALIVLGIGLLVAEVLAPSFGVLGVGGAIALAAGALLLFDRDIPELAIPLWLVATVVAASAAFVLLGGAMALRARRLPVPGGAGGMVGTVGTVCASGPDGTWAQLRGETWRVESDTPLATGQRVRVTAAQGLVLQVRADPASADPPSGEPPCS